MRHMVRGILLPEVEHETPLFVLRENLGKFSLRNRRKKVPTVELKRRTDPDSGDKKIDSDDQVGMSDGEEERE